MTNESKNEIYSTDMELIEAALLRNICGGAKSTPTNGTASLVDASYPEDATCIPGPRRDWSDYCGG